MSLAQTVSKASEVGMFFIRLGLSPFSPDCHPPVGKSVGNVCSPFELGDGALGQRWVARKVVQVEDRAHVAQRMPGDGGDLCLGTSGDGKPGDRRAAQIVEGEAGDASAPAGAQPRRLEAVRRPRLPHVVCQDQRRALRGGVERGLQRRAHRNDDASAGFALPQPDVLAVVSRPGQAQEIALPLSGSQRQQQRQVQMRCGVLEQGGLVVGGPDIVAAGGAVQPTTTGAGIGQHQPTVEAPRQDAGEYHPRIVSQPRSAAGGHAVAPRHEDAARAPVGQRGEREVAELLLDALDVPDVALARHLSEAEKFAARLVGMHHRQQRAARRHHLARHRLVVVLSKDIAEFVGLRKQFADAIRLHFGRDFKPKILWFFFTERVLWSQADMACARFRRHRVRCFDGAGGGSWRDGSLRASSSLRLCG